VRPTVHQGNSTTPLRSLAQGSNLPTVGDPCPYAGMPIAHPHVLLPIGSTSSPSLIPSPTFPPPASFTRLPVPRRFRGQTHNLIELASERADGAGHRNGGGGGDRRGVRVLCAQVLRFHHRGNGGGRTRRRELVRGRPQPRPVAYVTPRAAEPLLASSPIAVLPSQFRLLSGPDFPRRIFPDFSLFRIPAFNPRIKESRAEAKVAVLCDFAEAEEPAPEVNKRKGIALAPSSSVILSIPPRSSRLAIYIFVNCAGGARGGGSRKRLGTRSRCY
jgi:hypothetical protein